MFDLRITMFIKVKIFCIVANKKFKQIREKRFYFESRCVRDDR